MGLNPAWPGNEFVLALFNDQLVLFIDDFVIAEIDFGELAVPKHAFLVPRNNAESCPTNRRSVFSTKRNHIIEIRDRHVSIFKVGASAQRGDHIEERCIGKASQMHASSERHHGDIYPK